MNIGQLQSINSQKIAILEKHGWTLDRLATASTQQLAVLPGIGLKTATDAIREAMSIVNAELLKVSEKREYNPPPDLPVQRSVRVRRIYGETV